MVEDNTTRHDSGESAEEKPKRRRSFGMLGRAAKSARAVVDGETAAPPVPPTPTASAAPAVSAAPEVPAAEKPAAREESSPTDLIDVEAVDLSDETTAAAEPAAPVQDEAPAPVAAPRSPLIPLFQAPPVLAPRPGSGPRDEDEFDEDDDGDEAPRGTASSRRRSRRRSGGDGESVAPSQQREPREPREPRERVVVPITEPQRVKGSTRLEDKKQRRRDGRDAGRRRAVVTEAEFLARRESVDRVMVVRSADSRIEIGVLEDGVLAEHYVAKSANASLIGNVYLGKVQNVLPSMEAAFVDIGRGRNAVLYSGEVDWDAAAEAGEKNQPRRIELALKAGDRVLVQVTKDPVGHKGARLTSQISLPGRYLVYVPGGSMNGISRKLPDTERARLKKILKEVLPEGVGVIVRTAAEGATEEQLTRDVTRLTSQWQHISEQLEKANAPALLHSEPDLLVKIIRDVFNEDFAKLVIAGSDAQGTIESYLTSVAPDLLDRVESWTGSGDVFGGFRIQEQIDKALDRKVWLPSGGSLVIDRTEAMTVVDVNTGKFVGSGGNLEETVTKNNLEAAEEIVRQLRLRDIGGIIVIDFIDMVLENNRDLVLRRLVECLSRDRTKHQVAEVTSLGLVQMTRKKLGLGLAESMSDAPRQTDSKPEPRRRKQAPATSQPRQQTGSTHEITDNAKNALAMIAKSTLHREEFEAQAVAVVAASIAEVEGAPEAPSAAVGSAHAAEPVIPLPEVAAAPQRRVAPDADALLSTVLEALPEPKKPGQGRSRSRRVSTGALTAGDASRSVQSESAD
ncbi:MAG: Rne/Rng family ribonuclease [Naasia sp.]